VLNAAFVFSEGSHTILLLPIFFGGIIGGDPVDEWECERAKRIEKIQGNRNEVVMRDC